MEIINEFAVKVLFENIKEVVHQLYREMDDDSFDDLMIKSNINLSKEFKTPVDDFFRAIIEAETFEDVKQDWSYYCEIDVDEDAMKKVLFKLSNNLQKEV